MDNWVDLEISIAESLPMKWYLSETDIVLLRPSDGGSGSVLAKITSAKKSPDALLATLRCSLLTERLRNVGQGLLIRSAWRLSRVFR